MPQAGPGRSSIAWLTILTHRTRLMRIFDQFINDISPLGKPYQVRSPDQKTALDKARSAKKARSRPCPTPDASHAEGRQNAEARGPQIVPQQKQTCQRRNGKQKAGISIGPNNGRSQQTYLCGITSDPIREERVVWQSNES